MDNRTETQDKKDALLLVHCSRQYDPTALLRPRIRQLTEKFQPERRFVLHDDESPSQEYLGFEPARALYAYFGKISKQSFLDEVCTAETITICGSFGNSCHHTAYEAIMEETSETGNDVTIVLPTDAIKEPYGLENRVTMRDIIELDSDGKRLRGRLAWLANERLTPADVRALNVMGEYMRAVWRHGARVSVDGRVIHVPTNYQGITVSIDNSALAMEK